MKLLFPIIIVFKLLIILAISFDFRELLVTPTSYIINTQTTYSFYYRHYQDNFLTTTSYATSPVTSTTALTVTFPNQYTVPASITCQVQVNSGAKDNIACTVNSNQVVINGAFTDGLIVYDVYLWVSGVTNPSPAILTSQFIGKIGSNVAQPAGTQSVVQLQPATFTSCYITFNPNFVNRNQDMVFKITPKTNIQQSSTIRVTFQSLNYQNYINISNKLPITSTMACTNYSSNVLSSIQCTGNTASYYVTLSNIVSATTTSEISFAIKQFLSPPSTQSNDLVIITSYSGSNQIDTCNAYITDLTPNIITDLAIVPTNDTAFTVNKQYVMRLSFTLVDPIRQDDYFIITIPSGSIFTLLRSTIGGSGITGIINTNASSTSNVITIYMNGGTTTATAGTQIILTVGMYTAPPSTETTSAFILQIVKNGFPKQRATATIIPAASTLSGVSTLNAPTIVNSLSSITFTVTTKDPISSAGKFKITFPSSIVLSSVPTSCATLSGTNLATSGTCSIDTTNNIITITNLNSSTSIIGAQTLTIRISGIINPPSTASTSTFQIKSYYSSSDNTFVAQGTISGITATKNTILTSNVNIVPSSYIVLDSPVSLTINLIIVDKLSVGGYLILGVPNQITINSGSTDPNKCQIGINSTTTSATTCSISSNTSHYLFTFSNPFTVNITAGTNITLKLVSLATNPISTASVGSFTIETYNSDNSIVSSIYSNLPIQMTTPTTFNDLQITRSSNTNYALTQYTFLINQDSPMQASSIAKITFPTNIKPSASSACSQITPTSVASIQCNITGQIVQVVVFGTVASNINLTIKITNIRNPSSFVPSGSFSFQTKTANNVSKYSAGTFTDSLSNSVPTSFSAISGVFTDKILDTATTLTISFTPSISTTLPSYLQVTLDSSLIVSTLTCSSFINFASGACTPISTYSLNVTGIFGSSSMSFSISGFKIPVTAPTGSTVVISFDSAAYTLDESKNDIKFSLACILPCRTCSSTDQNKCLTCYNNTAVTTFIYYRSTSSQCLDTCPSGQYIDISLLRCSLCNSNCLTCQTTSTFCLTCNTSSSFKYLNVTSSTIKTCVSSCVSGMYPDLTQNPVICTTCINNCKTCNTSTICLTCLDAYFFYNNNCLAVCPVNITIANDPNNNCDLCDSTCATCSVTTTNCTSCASPSLFYNNKCWNQCPSPLVPQSGTCIPCDAKCQLCSLIATNCTKCYSGSSFPFLLNNNCLQTCTSPYYNNTANGICSLCSSLTINCDDCSSSTTCVSCNPNFMFFSLNSSCLNFVPDGYVNISGVAKACTNDCYKCSIVTSNCTACSGTLSLYNFQCISPCPIGFLSSNSVCISCTSPCKTCSISFTNCTSCISTLSPAVFLINNICNQTCPQFKYANTSTSTCDNCISPCLTCQSYSNCNSCIDTYFLYNKICSKTCLVGFTGINKICQACVSPCKTCQNSTNTCTSCITNYYYLQSTHTCLGNCGDGLYIDFLLQKCIGCTLPCQTCVNSSITCLSCNDSSLALENNLCLTSCPDKKFNSNGVCNNCPTNCSSCTSLTNCTSCLSNYVLYQNYCISSCPQTHSVIVNNTCTKCGDAHCYACTPADFCSQCESDYSLLKGICLTNCPAGYATNGTDCIQNLDSVLTSASTSSFPVPFTIAASVAVIACLMSKLAFSFTFLPGALYSLISIMQTGASGYFIYLYYVSNYVQAQNSEQQYVLYIALAGIGLLYFLNIIGLILQSIALCTDSVFKTWSIGANKCVFVIVTGLATIISHKFRNILFCKLFNFSIFSAPLQNVSKFKIFNIFSFLSIILHSAPIIAAAAIALTLTSSRSQLFYECIDVIVITAVMILLGFFNIWKPQNYFVNKTAEGYDLNRKIQVDDYVIESKLNPNGQDSENQVGKYNRFQHALKSNMPFKIQAQSSLDYISEKQYQDISIQALELINDKSEQKFEISAFPQETPGQYDTNFTVIFQKADKSMQHKIDTIKEDKSIQNKQQPSLRDRSAQMEEKNNFADKSAQQSNNLQDQSAQRTIFYQEDNSVQYSPSMMSQKPIMKDQSANVSRFSFKNKSIQNEPSVFSKSIQMRPEANQQSVQKSTIQKKDQGVQNYQSLEDRSLQANQTMTDKGNQRTISYKEQSAQMSRNAGIDYSAQMSPRQQVQFKQFHQDYPVQIQKTEKVLTDKDQSLKKQQPLQMREQQHQQELNVPKNQIKSYQQQLEDRIRQKQKQLKRIKHEIISKQRSNQQRKKLFEKKKQPNNYVVDIGKFYRNPNYDVNQKEEESKEISEIGQQENLETKKMLKPNAPLKKQQRQIEDQNIDEKQQTLQEIQLIDGYEQAQQENKQILQEDQSNKTQQQFIDMLQNNDQIVFDEDLDAHQQISQKKTPSIKSKQFIRKQTIPNKPQPLRQQQQQISQKPQNSTKLYSSIRPFLRKDIKANQNNDGPAIAVSQVDQSLNSQRQSINNSPIYPYNSRNFISDKEQKAGNNVPASNRTLGVIKDDYRDDNDKMRSLGQRQRKQINYNPTNKLTKPENNVSGHKSARQSNPLLMAGKSQFTEQSIARKKIGKGNPLKTAKKWEFQNQDRNLSDSGQFQVPNNRHLKQNQLILPYQTDKQQTQFKTTQIKMSNQVGAPYIRRQYNKQPMSTSNLPRKPQLNQPSNSEMSQEPYIEDTQSEVSNNKYRNNMILNQLLDRPSNDDLRDYYRNSKKKSKQKSRQKKSTSDLERIYLQSFDRKK